MSAAWPPRKFTVLLLARAGGHRLPTSYDPPLHRAVAAAITGRLGVVAHPDLAGHRPDPVTVRRVPGLETALAGLAEDGVLVWGPSGWSLRSRDRLAALTTLHSQPAERLAELDWIVEELRRRSAARPPVEPIRRVSPRAGGR